ncbi:MAG: calcium-binding protein, partial [Asticcacaulis sp.]|nr:calcium-binding protein [Asticcacaulis sp.]
VIEANGTVGGIDLVFSSHSYTLGNSVENLTLTGNGQVNGTGNGQNNVITGNNAANTLNGLAGNDLLDGGNSNDTMNGGLGDDTYVVGATGDVLTENVGEGIDLVRSSVDWTLGANFENLELTGNAGISGTGNTLDNKLTGNAGNNTLSGLDGNDTIDGGAGDDTMNGGLGNDTYYVDSGNDVVNENAGEGTDIVFASVDYRINSNIDNLTLTGAAVFGTGNGIANTIIGNANNNTLDGKS